MSKLEYITIERQRAHYLFGLLYMAYEQVTKQVVEAQEEQNRNDLIKALEDQIGYLHTRLHYTWPWKITPEVKSEAKVEDQIENQVESEVVDGGQRETSPVGQA